MAEGGKGPNGHDGKAAFRDVADRNKEKITRLIRQLKSVGKSQVPAHDARGLLEMIRRTDRSISSDGAHVAMVASIVTANVWTYKPRSAKK